MTKPTLLLFLLTLTSLSTARKCYFSNGDEVTSPKITPCNPPSSSTSTHSSCCNQAVNDACLSSGLCLGTWGKTPSSILWINGCTDPTWKDPACPQYCNPAPNATADSHNPGLKVCGDKTFCCSGAYADEKDCCLNSFTLGRGLGNVVRLLGTQSSELVFETEGAGDTGAKGETRNDGGRNMNAAGIVGGVLGALLLGVSTAFVFVFLQKRKLQKLWDEKCEEPFPKIRRRTSGDGDDGRRRRGEYNYVEYEGMSGSERTVIEMPTGENRIGQLP
ncbi:hypothetical protein QBC38DRAFT_476176 [Podospora fimiseda]|uniref:Mid2 domain-containing protein n=1 Tax=Podospora fimiseda TaxID=252190 RepID=A0AAN7BS78_9PEZI|nr:hypothetical protein QBC38DRAFT_476176 [Podospora fimiseda]